MEKIDRNEKKNVTVKTPIEIAYTSLKEFCRQIFFSFRQFFPNKLLQTLTDKQVFCGPPLGYAQKGY